jgi:amino acid transporter
MTAVDPSRAIDPSHDEQAQDSIDLEQFGYDQELRRAISPLASLAVAFSMISVSTGVFALFAVPYTTVGGWGIWLWLPVAAGLMCICAVYSHVGARIPLTGYAYQWNSRLVGSSYGWFTGWTCFLAFVTGTASVAITISVVFAPEFWHDPTKANVVLLAGIVTAVALVLNLISIRATAVVNNFGVTFELAGSLIAAAILFVGAIFFFKHSAGPSVLFQSGPVGGGSINLTAVGLAALLPVFVLLGWEGAADLAEETQDPRRSTPYAMLRANWLSIGTSIVMIICFAIAIPRGIPALINQPENPLFYIFRHQVGSVAVTALKVVVFIAMFSALLANMAVGTRMTYSLARDGMLPFSRQLAWVNPRTQTPMVAIVLVAGLSFAVNFFSTGIENRVVSITAVCYYATYALTTVAALWASRRGRLPDTYPGGFSLGRWLGPLCVVGVIFATIIVIDETVPTANHITAEYTGGALMVGILWWLLYLRPRLAAGKVGIARTNDPEPTGPGGPLGRRAGSPRVPG